MKEYQVVIIGGGATGVGILRDLSMRGIKALLLEQGGLAHGTSSRFHGLLHSGARYVMGDMESARECIEENILLRKMCKQCVEETEGFFVQTPEDPSDYVKPWLEACAQAGIETTEIDVKQARKLEPNLASDIQKVFRVPDSSIDGFRLVWHNAAVSRDYGSNFLTYHKVTAIETANGKVEGVHVINEINKEEFFIPCQYVVNAAGAWCGEIAHMAGLDVPVSPDRGTLIVFNYRFTSRVINRLHKSSDGDIFVPHGSVTILGTTSSPAKSPSDTRPTSDEVLRLLEIGKPLFPDINNYRILRAFAGTRPLYTPSNVSGRSASRNFNIVDHNEEGLFGLGSIFGGKLTTYRLMAEKMSDLVCKHLNVQKSCRTAIEPLINEADDKTRAKAKNFFSGQGVHLVEERLGNAFTDVVEKLEEKNGKKNDLLCECEMVSTEEVMHVAQDEATHSLTDIRLRTRLGMGTCQGLFCSLRTIGTLTERNIPFKLKATENLSSFLNERWKGLRPALWGMQLKELELGRAIYLATLNIDGAEHEQAK